MKTKIYAFGSPFADAMLNAALIASAAMAVVALLCATA